MKKERVCHVLNYFPTTGQKDKSQLPEKLLFKTDYISSKEKTAENPVEKIFIVNCSSKTLSCIYLPL